MIRERNTLVERQWIFEFFEGELRRAIESEPEDARQTLLEEQLSTTSLGF